MQHPIRTLRLEELIVVNLENYQDIVCKRIKVYSTFLCRLQRIQGRELRGSTLKGRDVFSCFGACYALNKIKFYLVITFAKICPQRGQARGVPPQTTILDPPLYAYVRKIA